MKASAEALGARRAPLRGDSVRGDFEDEIADAELELKDAEAEFADAEAKFAEAEEKLSDAERELGEKKQELSDAEQELEDAEDKLLNGEKDLAEAEKELADGKKDDFAIVGIDFLRIFCLLFLICEATKRKSLFMDIHSDENCAIMHLIQQWNDIPNPDVIYVGQQLVIYPQYFG